MKDLLDNFEVDYTFIFDGESEEIGNKKLETTAERVINRCKRSINTWASEDHTVATLFGR